MCGIAGVVGLRDEALVRRMTGAIAHRGPDDASVYAEDGATLGHRRLSVIDIAGGHQPMGDPEGALWVTYNGEIYNFRALREELQARGHVFRTDCDTEAILHAYREWGDACVTRFRGMFAFALWDAPRRRLLLARDPVGVKPLYYAIVGDRLYFASEIKALLVCPEIPRDLDPEGLDDFLSFLYTYPPRTFYKAIRQLPPATRAVWSGGEWHETRYWSLAPPQGDADAHDEGAWIEESRAALDDAVASHLVSDVPVGAFLSGGLDSATVVYHMTRHGADPVNTYTVGFGAEGGRYDERAAARALAAHFGARHHELTAEADAENMLDTLLAHFGEPFGNPSAPLFHAMCGRLREHVKVVLSGDGGDENFAGYPRHAGIGLAEGYRRVPESLRRHVIAPLLRQLPESTTGFHALRRIREFSEGSSLPFESMYARWITYFQPEEKAALYGPDLQGALQGRDAIAPVRALFAECPGGDPVSRALYVDLQSFLPHNLLQCTDRMSMAHGVEARVPLADAELIARIMPAPGALKVRGRETKRLLRRAMRDRLPPDALKRAKMGFNPPLGVWLNTALRPLVDDLLSPKAIAADGLFHPEPIQTLIHEHRAGRRDHTWRLWALLLIAHWRRRRA